MLQLWLVKTIRILATAAIGRLIGVGYIRGLMESVYSVV